MPHAWTRWRPGIGAFAAVLCLFAAGCGGSDSGGGTAGGETAGGTGTAGASTTAQSSEPIDIGFAIGLSGFLEVADVPAKYGALAAIDDINAKGGVAGRKLKASFADVKSDPAAGANAAIKLLDGGAEVLVTACGFDFGGGTAAIEANERGVLSISTCGGGSKYGPSGAGDLVFTTATSSFSEGATMAEYAEKLGLKKPFIVVEDAVDYDVEIADTFAARWEELGHELAGKTSMKNDDQSFSAQISEIERSGADSVLLASYMPGAAKLMREARSAGLDVTFLGTEDWDGDDWKDAIPGLSDAYFAAPASLYGDDSNEEFNALLEKYKADNGGKAPPLALGLISGYSVVQMIARAIEENGGSTDGEELAAIMEGWKDEPFMIGPTTFDDATHYTLSRDERVMQIEDGDTTLKETYRPQSVPTDG